MTINAQSLKNKMNEFRVLVEEKKPQIISITESWGEEWISDGIYALKGYTMYRDDRNRMRGGGLYYTSGTTSSKGSVVLLTRTILRVAHGAGLLRKMGRKYWLVACIGAPLAQRKTTDA